MRKNVVAVECKSQEPVGSSRITTYFEYVDENGRKSRVNSCIDNNRYGSTLSTTRERIEKLRANNPDLDIAGRFSVTL